MKIIKIIGYKLISGVCRCNSIENCDVCPNTNTCSLCATSYYINTNISPNTCVSTCPTNTHPIIYLSILKCIEGIY